MRTFIASLFLSVTLSSFAQVAPLASGSVLAYDVFGAKQGLLQSEVAFQQSKEQRVLKLNIEENGDRAYRFTDGKDFAVYDKFFVRTANRGKPISPSEQFQLLPKSKKMEVDAEWEYSRTGSTGNECGNWSVTHRQKAKQGPDVVIKIDGTDVSVKTLLIETRTEPKYTRDDCTSGREERVYLYSPDLNEIVSDQELRYTTGG